MGTLGKAHKIIRHTNFYLVEYMNHMGGADLTKTILFCVSSLVINIFFFIYEYFFKEFSTVVQ